MPYLPRLQDLLHRRRIRRRVIKSLKLIDAMHLRSEARQQHAPLVHDDESVIIPRIEQIDLLEGTSTRFWSVSEAVSEEIYARGRRGGERGQEMYLYTPG